METALPYRQYRPAVVLADYIECYWAWRGKGPSIGAERLIPGGRIELAFNFGDEMDWLMDDAFSMGTPFRDAHVMGQRDRIYYCRALRRVELFGVRFRHGCFGAFSATPQSLLLNRLLPVQDLLGPMAQDWHARLRDAASDPARVRLMDELLCGALEAGRPVSPAVLAALALIRESAGITVETVGERIGWGYKKLERAFLAEVGYTPKAYSRLVRFNKAIRKVDMPAGSLTDIGYSCGYYDQAHFIKDFHRFAGLSPRQFREEGSMVAKYLIRNQAV
jgi:AraC-like DNA-binding protein